MSKIIKKTPKKQKNVKEKVRFQEIEQLNAEIFLLQRMIDEKKASREELEQMYGLINFKITSMVYDFLKYVSLFPNMQLSKMASALLNIRQIDLNQIVNYEKEKEEIVVEDKQCTLI